MKENEAKKSVSVEVTWAVRFSELAQVEKFIATLVTEVCLYQHE